MAKTVKINGVTYNDVKEFRAPLASDPSQVAVFPETSDATAEAGEILAGKSGYVNGVKVGGTMPDRGTVNSEISAKDGTVTIQQGRHSGSGKVSIAAAEQEKLVSGNIKAGVTVLGVEGDTNVVDTSAGDIGAGDLPKGKIGFSKGVKYEGTATYPSLSLADGVLAIS